MSHQEGAHFHKHGLIRIQGYAVVIILTVGGESGGGKSNQGEAEMAGEGRWRLVGSKQVRGGGI